MELCCEIMCVAERVVAGYLADLDTSLRQHEVTCYETAKMWCVAPREL